MLLPCLLLQMKTLTEKLQSVEAERDGLLSERRASSQTTTEEMERMQCRVSALSEERDELQDTLEGMRQESDQLRAKVRQESNQPGAKVGRASGTKYISAITLVVPVTWSMSVTGCSP